jgi:uncharacterized membrane protein YkvA (DUF1232 family)
MNGVPDALNSYLTRASRVLRSPKLARSLFTAVGRKLAAEGSTGAALNSVRTDLQTSLALVRSWMSGEYLGVSYQSAVLVVAGLVYLATPVDAIPDVLPGMGFIDDLTVLSFVFGRIGKELELFRKWHTTSSTIELPQ